MSDVSNNKSTQQNVKNSENTEIDKKACNALDTTSLTFKDWKTLKDDEAKSKPVNKQTKSKNPNRTCNRDHRNKNAAGFPARYSNVPITFNAINNFGMNAYDSSFYNFDFNNFNGYDRQIYNYLNSKHNVLNNVSGSSTYHNFSDTFFASDGIYYQTDLMQKPLKKDLKPKDFSHKLETGQNSDKKKKQVDNNKPKNNTKNVVPLSPVKTEPTTNTSLSEEPKIYVPNPNVSKDGKAFIPKPKLPEENPEISKEEKKKQWKEYREAMKPFKNREFYNAKRVVQRLGKKDVSELDERELFRLTNAREVMASHKARLTAKYSDYVKAENKSNELGEVYVLKKPPTKDCEVRKTKTKGIQNYCNLGEVHQSNVIEPGRKILGGYSNFKGFIPSNLLDGNTQLIGQISAL